jgi:hypothetical protein
MVILKLFLIAVASAALAVCPVSAFAPGLAQRSQKFVLKAGGFEWEDPGEAFDQGVDNPFKKSSEEGLKIDPARLLGPRLNGSNLYLVGMMGSGKSSVGDVVARRKLMPSPMLSTGVTFGSLLSCDKAESLTHCQHFLLHF